MTLHPQLCIGMSLAPTWLSGEGWRRPGSGIEGLYGSDLALDIARRAEAAHLDFVFRPDASALPLDVLEQSFGFSSLDPTLLLAALTRETRAIGLVTTLATTFGHPYAAARALMSLHWLSQGRAGWNVVTALQGHANFGLAEMPGAAARHARAREFTEVVERLWASFPAEALVVDRASGRYADTGAIRPIDHHGAHFAVEGPLNLPQFPGPRIPLMQAGSSENGIDLAGRHADMVFAATPDRAEALALRARLSAAARAHGRAPGAVRLLPGLSLYLAPTRAEARALFLANHARVSRPERIARLARATGLDVTGWAGDRRITAADLPTAPPAHPRLAALIRTGEPRVEELLAAPELLASVHWQVIGTLEDALTAIAEWFAAGAIDGFIAVPGGGPEVLALTLEGLVPRLAAVGLFRDRYAGRTLAAHLDGPR